MSAQQPKDGPGVLTIELLEQPAEGDDAVEASEGAEGEGRLLLDDARCGDGDDALASEILEQVLEARGEREQRARESERARDAERIHGVLLGVLVEVTEAGPRVIFPGCPAPDGLVARSAASLGTADVGRRVALVFEGGDRSLPMLVGLIENEKPGSVEPHPALGSLTIREQRDHVEIASDKPIRIRSGEATITLTPKGRVVVSGTYVLTRASITNRIRGGSVRIN